MGGKGSGVGGFTHEQLKEAHVKQAVKLMHARANVKFWKERARAAEKKIEEYVFIDKPPEYFFSFSGLMIFRRFYRNHGLTALQMEVIVIISYCGIMLYEDHKLFRRNFVARFFDNIVALEGMGYITQVMVPGKSRSSKRKGHALTKKGKDLEADSD